MTELIEKDLVYKIIGCAMKVHNEIGHGLREKTYERATCVEFNHQKIIYTKQSKYPVFYRDELIDEYIPDLEVEGKVIVEIKTVDTIIDEHRGQLLNPDTSGNNRIKSWFNYQLSTFKIRMRTTCIR